MSVSRQNSATGWTDPDDAPDLTSPQWADVMDKATVRRSRPKSPAPKVSTTLRLDPDLVEHFRSTGSGWQTRINDTLRKAAGL